MKKGMGIALALGGVTLLGTLYVTLRVDHDAKVAINPQMAEQYKGLNEMQGMALAGAVDAFDKAKGRMPASADELLPEYLQEMPKEAFSKLTVTVATFDGKGGWVYDGVSFKPNHSQLPNVP